jgi:hypothetical protein
MKRSLPALAAVALAFALASCESKVDVKPAAVTSYKPYVDPDYRFSVSYPEGWVSSIASGRAVFYSATEVADAFSSFEPKGQRGGKIEVKAERGDAARVDQMIAEIREVFTKPDAVKGPEQTTVNGMPATKVTYQAELEEGGAFKAERYFIVADGIVTYLETAVIGNYNDYAAIFDEVRKTFQPGRLATAAPDTSAARRGDTTAAAPRDSIVTDPPSAEMKPFSGSTFSMSYPANFDATSNGEGAIFSGARRDSYVQVTVYPTQDVPLDKIADASKKNYGGRAASKTSVGGAPGYVFSFGKGAASGRAYYTVVGKRLFVITTTWYTPQADLYTPAYDRMIASFKGR